MYCMHCGEKIDENLLICPHCGTAQNQVTKKDYGGIGWGILGYFVPMAGIILFFIWKNDILSIYSKNIIFVYDEVE